MAVIDKDYDYESDIEIIPKESTARKQDLQEAIYGEDQTVIDDAVYFPDRLEYFAGLALQALLPISPPKHRNRCIPEAIALAKQMAESLDESK